MSSSQFRIVTVNGSWPGQNGRIHALANPCLKTDELRAGAHAGTSKALSTPLRIITVGAINSSKGTDRVLRIARLLSKKGVVFQLDIVGDGDARQAFEKKAEDLGLSRQVIFHGWLPREAVNRFYQDAQISLLPSASEGWPKVLSEAMAYGAVPLAGAISSIPQILGDTGAGKAIDPFDIAGYVAAIEGYLADPASWAAARDAGLKAAASFTYDAYLQAVRAMFLDVWGIRV